MSIPAKSPLFRSNLSQPKAPSVFWITEHVRFCDPEQLSYVENPGNPPLKSLDSSPLRPIPRSNVKRPISIVDPTEQRSGNGLSALARPFVPAQPPPHPARQPYNNSMSGLPSHWIPFHGSAFGLFYDPLTDMFISDGPPRRSIHRPWDRSLPSAPHDLTWFDLGNAPPCAFVDHLHVQPMVMIDAVLNAHLLEECESRAFCFCVQTWGGAFPHRCPVNLFWPPQSAVVPPRGWVPGDWVCRDIPVRDKGYLGDEHIHEFANQAEGAPPPADIVPIVPIVSEDPFEDISTSSSESTSRAALSSNDWIRGYRNQRRSSMVSVIMEEMEESSEDSVSSSSTYYSAIHTMT